ncbi:hypothetical protein QEN19_002900 [Hanseniaspora menglaensis]
MFRIVFKRSVVAFSNNRKSLNGNHFIVDKVRCYSGKNSSSLKDTIHVQKLNINTVVGKNLWNITAKQKLQVSLDYNTDFTKSAEQDDLANTLSYAVLSKEITKHLENNTYDSIFQLNKNLTTFLKTNFSSDDKKFSIALDTTLLESHLRSDSITLRYTTNDGYSLIIKNLRVLTYIGVFTFERLQKQYMDLELEISLKDISESSTYGKFDLSKLIYAVTNFLESSNFKTVESLVQDTSNIILSNDEDHLFLESRVKVIKPQAILQCQDGVGVTCVRAAEDFKSPILQVKDEQTQFGFNLPIPTTELPPLGSKYKVYLSVGTNQGDKLYNIQTAIKYLNNLPEISEILAISSIYKSKPMYFLEQSQFYNLALSLETTLPPTALLEKLKEIEYDVLHRVKLFDNGPRPIDLDIIYYMHNGKHLLVNESTLIVPHKLMLERGFVLLPLTEILDPNDSVHPVSFEPIQNQLNQIINQGALDLERVTPLEHGKEITWQEGETNIMSIVNITLDSFSDGSLGKAECFEKLKNIELAGGQIIDIGACSTNPKSVEQVSETVEIERINNIIDLIDHKKFIISLDSYRINVIEKFIDKIDVINDIGFDFFEKADRISRLLAKNKGKCYILNHVPANTIQGLKEVEQNKKIADPDISMIVAKDLFKKFNYLLQHGVNASQIILDPGLGFGKKTQENFDLIKNFKNAWNSISENYKDVPVLFGYSRKRFLNSLQKDLSPVDRDLEGSILLTAIDKQKNVMVRTHNIDFTKRTLDLLKKLK